MDVLKIQAKSAAEAKEIAKKHGFDNIRNVTTLWHKAKCPKTRSRIKEFQVDMLLKNHRWNSAGKGCLYTLKSPVYKYNKIPWKLVTHKQIGERTVQKVYEVRIEEDDTLIAQTNTKKQAIALAKKLIKKYKKKLIGICTWKVLDNPVTFELYPKRRGIPGLYVVFGTAKQKLNEYEV